MEILFWSNHLDNSSSTDYTVIDAPSLLCAPGKSIDKTMQKYCLMNQSPSIT